MHKTETELSHDAALSFSGLRLEGLHFSVVHTSDVQ